MDHADRYLSHDGVWTEGLIAGLLGYVVVVVFFLLTDLLGGRGAFHTPAVLGWSFVGGYPGTGPVVAPAPVLAYNGLHLLSFLLLGAGGAWLVHETELHPRLWYVTFFVVLGSVFLGLLLLLILTSPLRDALPVGSVVTATGLAGVAMGVFFWRSHPGLRQRIEAASEEAD